ncbi:MAG: DNA-processing protein DprA [Armatimonadota bacterium]|nr:DNA-processing protein DprA [Armatimonadota bacterium]MCX7777835.1 DNA-processing protein DprA [Armatimonadota bacterium]MDW8025826.1 DNA-processing protein DprA [Armatimonadota bacterium]
MSLNEVNDELVAWVRLTRTGISPERLLSLLHCFKSPMSIFEADEDALLSVEGITDVHLSKLLRAKSDEGALMDAQRLISIGGKLVTYFDEQYPPLLRQLSDAPIALYVIGELPSSDELCVAIVGTRRPSDYGRQVSYRLAYELASYGAVVVSGMAVGIDGAAHQGALDAGGKTIAVLGCGVDVAYPRAHAKLRERIIGSGAVLSEFPLGATPQPWHFPVRNRLISGMTMATIVVEAPHNSGALLTADWALEQGREVLVVPGPITNPNFKGNHQLIKEGAQVVESAEDVFAALGIPLEGVKASKVVVGYSEGVKAEVPTLPGLSQVELKILEVLSRGERHIDQIVRESGAPISEVSMALLQLEVKKLATRQRGGFYALSQPQEAKGAKYTKRG